MAKDQEDQGTQEAPDLNQVIFDVREVIMPFLQAKLQAEAWAKKVGVPPLKAPHTLDVEFDPDLSVYTNAEVGRMMNECQEIKGYYGRTMAQMKNAVRDREEALDTTKKVIKDALLRGGFKGTATALNDRVDIDKRVIKGKQALNKARDQLEEITAAYKAIDGKYKTLSRNVTLITDEHDTFRRVDRVEGYRGDYQPGGPQRRGRRADRVAKKDE